MRLHFAAEVILELVHQKLKGIIKIGAQIAQAKARIDFKWGKNISTIFPVLEKETLKVIEANQEVESTLSDEESEEVYIIIYPNHCSPARKNADMVSRIPQTIHPWRACHRYGRDW